MSLNLAEFKNDLIEVRDDQPLTFSFDGTSHVGFRGNTVTTEELEPGGFLDQFDLNLHCPIYTKTSGTFTLTFGSEPIIGSTIVVPTSGTFKVGRLDRSQDDLEFILGLRSMNR